MRMRIGSIQDILDMDFEGSALQIISSYPKPYLSSPISKDHFKEEGERILMIREHCYTVELRIEIGGKEDQGVTTSSYLM